MIRISDQAREDVSGSAPRFGQRGRRASPSDGVYVANIAARIVTAPVKLIRWWWRQFHAEWVAGLLLLVAIALIWALGLRLWHPKSVLVIPPFETSAEVASQLGATGRTISNMVSDDLERVVSRSMRVTVGEQDLFGWRREQPNSRRLSQVLFLEKPHEVEVTIGENQMPVALELSGFSLARVKAEWNRVRQDQKHIVGDAVEDAGRVTLRARMSGFRWRAGPMDTSAVVLDSLTNALALAIWADLEPGIAGAYHLAQRRPESPDSAITHFKRWVAHDAGNANARTALGLAYDLAGQSDAALIEYQEAFRLVPTDSVAGRRLARSLAAHGQRDDAKALLEDLNISLSELAVPVALDLLRNGDKRTAIEVMKDAIAESPERPSLYTALGFVLIGEFDATKSVLHLPATYGAAFMSSGMSASIIEDFDATHAVSKGNAAYAVGHLAQAYQTKTQLEWQADPAEEGTRGRVAQRQTEWIDHDAWPLLIPGPEETGIAVEIPSLNGNTAQWANSRDSVLDETVAALERSVQYSQRDPRALYNLGVALSLVPAGDSAVSLFREAIRQDSTFIDAYLELGNALLGMDSLDAALAAFLRVQELGGESERVDYPLGVTYARQAQADSESMERSALLDSALARFASALGRRPDDAATLYSLGVALFQQNRFDESINYFQQALDSDENFVPARYYLGVAYLKTKDYDDAITALAEAAIHNVDPAVTYVLGVAQFRNGARWSAVESIDEAIDNGYDMPEAHYVLGRVWNQLGQPAQAMSSFRNALRREPGYAEAHLGLGIALLQLKQRQNAIEQFELAIQSKPSLADAHYALGYAQVTSADNSDIEAAIAALRNATSYRGGYRGQVALGIAQFRVGKLEASLESIGQAVRMNRAGVAGLHNLGVVYAYQGELDSALTYLNAVPSGQRTPATDYMLGYVRLWRSDSEAEVAAAVQNFRRAVTTFPAAQYGLSGALYQAGLYDEAIQSYGRTAEMFPQVRSELGSLLLARDRVQEAIEQFRVAIRFDPDDATALNNLAWSLYHQGTESGLAEAAELSDRSLMVDGIEQRSRWMYLDTRANIALDAGDPLRALGLFEQAIELTGPVHDIQTAMLHLGRGMALLELARNQEAVYAFGDAAAIDRHAATVEMWHEAHYSPAAVERLSRLQKMWLAW